MMDDKFKIHVNIGGFRIPLNVPRSDEEKYRKAEKMVTFYLEKYQEMYKHHRYEDILKLIAFQLAVNIAGETMEQDITPVTDRIKALEQELDKVLGEE
jgi:cell division protein ZapA